MENTKGPWKVMFDAEHISIVECVGHPRTIGEAFISKNRLEKDEAMANAKLMAAAPDLLEALKKANKMLMAAATEAQRKEIHRYLSGGYVESIEDAVFKDSLGIEAAIRKATGAN